VAHPPPTARRRFETAKRHAILIALITATALIAAATVSFTQQKVYRASTQIVIGQAGGIFQPQFGNAFQPFTQTMTSLLKSDVVATTVIRELGLHETPETLLENVHVSSTPGSAVLQVSFDSHSRTEAVRTLGRMASTFTALVRQKLGGTEGQRKRTSSIPPITATVFDPAHASPTPISPKPARTLAFAGIVGLLLGGMLALLREALDDRLQGRDEMEEYFGAPVIAGLPKHMLGRSALASETRPGRRRRLRPQTEGLDALRVQLSRNDARRKRGRVVVITSGPPGEGKSAVAANLGATLALAGKDVICVDADPMRPSLSHYFDLDHSGDNDGEPTAGTVTPADETLRDVSLRNDPVRALDDESHERADGSDGKQQAAPRRTSGRLRLLVWSEQDVGEYASVADLAVQMRSRAGYVVVDAPPLPAGATVGLLSVADETIVVAREEKTTKEQARFVRQMLERLNVPSYSMVSISSRTGRPHLLSSRVFRRSR
jgi:capsular polysaccharide biosynthesis protein/Mrp family chromosome partitioning ATPase